MYVWTIDSRVCDETLSHDERNDLTNGEAFDPDRLRIDNRARDVHAIRHLVMGIVILKAVPKSGSKVERDNAVRRVMMSRGDDHDELPERQKNTKSNINLSSAVSPTIHLRDVATCQADQQRT